MATGGWVPDPFHTDRFVVTCAPAPTEVEVFV